VKNISTVDAVEAVSSNPLMGHRINIPRLATAFTKSTFFRVKSVKQKYIQMGLEVEDPNIRLPCFDPVKDDFPPKLISKRLLKVYEGIKDAFRELKLEQILIISFFLLL